MHPSTRRRRRHSDELKAKVVAACGEPGASISAVALAHGLNANLVRKWRTGRSAKPAVSGVVLGHCTTRRCEICRQMKQRCNPFLGLEFL